MSSMTTVAMSIVSDSMYWETQIVGIQFGSDDADDKWAYKDTYVKYDSGVQCVYVPEDDYSWYVDSILNYSTGWYSDSQYGSVTSCDEVDIMPTIHFMLKGNDGNDYWTEWLPKDYMVEIGDF